jgi:hypothetical protein
MEDMTNAEMIAATLQEIEEASTIIETTKDSEERESRLELAQSAAERLHKLLREGFVAQHGADAPELSQTLSRGL